MEGQSTLLLTFVWKKKPVEVHARCAALYVERERRENPRPEPQPSNVRMCVNCGRLFGSNDKSEVCPDCGRNIERLGS